MPDSELLARIEAGEPAVKAGNPTAEKVYHKYVIVDLSGSGYAIPAESVREIVMDVPVHYLPFVPPYIRGLVNRHGEPYTAIDLNVLFRKDAASGELTLLVLNIENDRLALVTSGVREIVRVEETLVFPISENEDEAAFLMGTVRVGDNDIFIVSIEGVQKKMEADLGSS